MLKTFMTKRLKEPSTWRGIVMLITLFGVSLSPDQKEGIITAGVAVIGALGAFFPDTFGS